MALKDLIASKADLAEEVIEELVADHIRYDVEKKEIGFTPEAHKLSNKTKVLVYLVALQGWPFVVEQSIPTDIKPADLEEQTGIAGGSLRPVLKELKDRNLITENNGRYSVRPVALNAIREILNESSSSAMQVPRNPQKRKTQSNKKSDDSTIDENNSATANHKTGIDKTRKPKSTSNSGVGDRFHQLIMTGFFDDAKSLADVQTQLHRDAIIISQTSLPNYLLKGVRNGHLEREKANNAGKVVWMYKRKM